MPLLGSGRSCSLSVLRRFPERSHLSKAEPGLWEAGLPHKKASLEAPGWLPHKLQGKFMASSLHEAQQCLRLKFAFPSQAISFFPPASLSQARRTAKISKWSYRLQNEFPVGKEGRVSLCCGSSEGYLLEKAAILHTGSTDLGHTTLSLLPPTHPPPAFPFWWII